MTLTVPLLTLFLLGLTGAGPVVERIEQQPSHQAREEIVWRDRTHKEALFVPGAAIDSFGEVAGPVSEATRHRIRRQLERRPVDARYPECTLPTIGDSGPGLQTAGPLRERPRLSIAATLTKYDVSIVARVNDTVPGWIDDAFGGYAATLVRIDVEEVLSDKRDALKVGTRLTYLQQSGTLSVAGIHFCTRRPGYNEVAPGDRVLVVGSYDDANPEHIVCSGDYVFSVVDDVVKTPRANPDMPSQFTLRDVRPEL